MKFLKFTSYVFPKLAAKIALNLFLTPEKIKRPPHEQTWYLNAQKFMINDEFAAYEWGKKENPVILLVHGWAGRGTQMTSFTKSLLDAGFRVIALDGPAHGDSLGEQTNAGDFARFLVTAQQHIGEIHGIIAHSFGAGCSVLALNFGLKVKNLVLIAGPSDYAAIVDTFLGFLKISSKSENHFIKVLTEKAQLSPKDLHIVKIGTGHNINSLIVHDEQDKEVPFQCALDIHNEWPHSQLLATKGLGHRRILKDSEVIRQVTQFLSIT